MRLGECKVRREMGFHFPTVHERPGYLSCLVNKMGSPVFPPPCIMKTVRTGPAGAGLRVRVSG